MNRVPDSDNFVWESKGMLAVGAGGDKCAYVLGYLAAIMAFHKGKYQCTNKQTVYQNMCGTSAGAIVCARLLQYLDDPCQFGEAVDNLFNSLRGKKLVERWNPFGAFFNAIESVLFHRSLYKNNLHSKIVDMLQLSGDNMYATHNLSIAVWNLNKMQYETMTNPEDIALAVAASASVPFVFEPVTIKDANGEDQQYVDGGVGHIIPVLEIIKWCESLKNTTSTKEHLDIMICYPIEQNSFSKSMIATGSHGLINDGQLSLYGVVWNNLHNDISILNKYFSSGSKSINIVNDRYFKKQIDEHTELNVRVFAPSEPFCSDFLHIDTKTLMAMKKNGECVANNLLQKIYKQKNTLRL